MHLDKLEYPQNQIISIFFYTEKLKFYAKKGLLKNES